MRILDMIAKKRDGAVLNNQEINSIVHAYTKDQIPDYQMAALLMAIFIRGMTAEETADLTMAMAKSGNIVDLSSVPGIKVDKHSTGGVADTTTLILAPLVAAAGTPVAKMSGRGLGFTGGTIDKLESIPGFRTTLMKNEFIENLTQYNLAITGQSADVAPADGKIYALRDATATIESIPLIASSIMSKKIAAGADKILLDVKVGAGAFMKNLDDAVQLATTMVNIGDMVNRETIAVLTNMEEPLGHAIGNSLEVEEAINVLNGKGPSELRQVCLTLGAHMLVMAQTAPDVSTGYKILDNLLENKKALRKFQEFITAQGGNGMIVTDHHLLPRAKHQVQVKSLKSGFIHKINAYQIGYSAMLLGAGREYKGQTIDLAAGLVMKCRVGDFIEKDQPLAILYTNDFSKVEKASTLIAEAIICGDGAAPKTSWILGLVDKNGFVPA